MSYLKELVFMFDTFSDCLEQSESKAMDDKIKACMKMIELKLSSEVVTRFPSFKSVEN